jgi:phosphoribosylformylglycinamidine synthase
LLFGEDQGRYVVTARGPEAAAILAEAKAAGIAAQRLGATGGDALTLPGEEPILTTALAAAHEAWLPDFMTAPRRETP